MQKNLSLNDFHKFEQKGKYFIYLPTYGFATEINREDFDLINSETIIDFIKTNNVSKRSFKYFKEHGRDLDYGLFLNVANCCNLSCPYCFAAQGTYNKKKGMMTLKTAKKAIDFIFQKVDAKHDVSIIFFGGEPTLAFDVIKDTTIYIESKYSSRRYILRIVTNGTLLCRDYVDFIKSHNIELVISLDGGKRIQDTNRPSLLPNTSSFDMISNNLPYVLKKMDFVVARGTYSKFNDSLVDIYKDLLRMGFDEVDVVPNILDSEENKKINQLFHRMDELTDYIVYYCENNEDFPFGIYLGRIISVLRGNMENKIDCGFGKHLFCIDYSGNIYPCHRFTSYDDFIMGNINDEIIIKNPLKIKPNGSACAKCWNRFSCQHNCSFNNYMIDKSMTKNNITYCAYSKKLTESVIYLLNSLNNDDLSRIIEEDD